MTDIIPDLIKGHLVTEQVYKERTAHILEATEGDVVLKTPENDTKAIQDLLELSGPLGDSYLKVPKDQSICAKCGRQYSLLDITKGGIEVHGKQVTKDILSGKHGHISNPTNLHGITCCECGTRRVGVGRYSYYSNHYVGGPDHHHGGHHHIGHGH